MKRISVKDASLLSFLVQHPDPSDAEVNTVLEKADPSIRVALQTARHASSARKAKTRGLGSKTGRSAKAYKTSSRA